MRDRSRRILRAIQISALASAIVICLASCSGSDSNPGSPSSEVVTFSRTYEAPESIDSLIGLSDGGCLLGGEVYEAAVDAGQPAVTRTDAQGEVMWWRMIELNSAEGWWSPGILAGASGECLHVAFAPAQTDDSGSPVGDPVCQATYLSANGGIVWQRMLTNEFTSNAVTPFGGVCASGDQGFALLDNGVVGGEQEVHVLKFDATGTSAGGWFFELPVMASGDGFWPTIFELAADGGYFVGGHIFRDGGSDNAYVVKFSATGQEEWRRLLSDWASDSTLVQGAATPDGGCLVYGATGDLTARTLKLDSSGNVTWFQNHAAINGELTAAAVLADGDCVFGVLGSQDGEQHSSLVRIGGDGNLEWTRDIGAFWVMASGPWMGADWVRPDGSGQGRTTSGCWW
jgi:hypothetical protein